MEKVVSFKTARVALKVMLLHGNLDVWVKEAKNLPNMDKFHKNLGDVFGVFKSKSSKESHETSDPYVTINVAGAVIGRTFVIENSESPAWMQHFVVPVAHYAAEVLFLVKDNDVVGSQLIGSVGVPVEQLCSGQRVEGTYPVLDPNGKPWKTGAVLSVSIKFTPMELLTHFNRGVGSGPDYHGVPGTYFPLRKGCRVRLYQDAHVDDGRLPGLKLENHVEYRHGHCWGDVFKAISEAHRFVYITGWSVYHSVRLVRDGGGVQDTILGDLLKHKSQEGVRVLLLIWDDPTSRNVLGYKTDGLMQTHDEETRRFFKNSSVHVLLCPRSAAKGHSWAKKQVSLSFQCGLKEFLPALLLKGFFSGRYHQATLG